MQHVSACRWQVGHREYDFARDARRASKATGKPMLRLPHFHATISQQWRRELYGPGNRRRKHKRGRWPRYWIKPTD